MIKGGGPRLPKFEFSDISLALLRVYGLHILLGAPIVRLLGACVVPGVSDRVYNPQKREVVTIPSISRKLIQFARNALKRSDPSN